MLYLKHIWWHIWYRMTHWLYTKVVRSMLVYSSLVRWPKPQQITASRSLAKIQRAAPLEVLGVVKGTPTTKMEVIQYFPPLDILIKRRARMSAYRLQCNGSLCYHQANKHSQIGDILQIDILDLMSVGWHRKLTLTNHTMWTRLNGNRGQNIQGKTKFLCQQNPAWGNPVEIQ